MDIKDRSLGLVLMLVSLVIYSYYTFWVLVTPFIDEGHFVQAYFLARQYALIIPALAATLGVCCLASFVGLVMVRSRKP